ncbi:MAG: hypothetical protein GAK29_04343 [Acinetobacter bereziniae]|uniref:Uncharacterized protein n=1 Tax=Acinetobacter bereziniae TaxID=106648 RepID=A0A833UJ81_ACIBZ|nr:MAG: hypothetical protein GAK29_04343 [Acinetobacter bereziniae]
MVKEMNKLDAKTIKNLSYDSNHQLTLYLLLNGKEISVNLSKAQKASCYTPVENVR